MLHYQLSYWERDSFFRDIDVAIIGSGIVGLSAAIHLKEQAPKLKVVVLERGPLPIGASTRNAGFACFGSISELLDDLQHSSLDEVLQLVEKRYRGLQKLRSRYQDTTIGYEALGGYEVFRPTDQTLFEECADKLAHLNEALSLITGSDTYKHQDDQIEAQGLAGVQHLILNQKEGQLHTGKLMHTLLRRAQELEIHCLCGITVTGLDPIGDSVQISTDHGWTINTSRALIATNGFAAHLLPELEVKPARNQVLITKPIPGLSLKGCFHYDRGYVYFRNVGDRILLGGGRNLNPQGEETDVFGYTEQVQNYLLQILAEHIAPAQSTEVDYWWSGIMGVGQQKKPIIDWVNPRTVAAVRLGGMGVALGTEAGEQAAGLLLEG